MQGHCKIGYRDKEFVKLAFIVHDGDICPCEIMRIDYEGCIEALPTIKHIGPKIKDFI